MAPLLRRRGTSVARGWLFFGNRILTTCEDQKTTTPAVFDVFPSFAGGEFINTSAILFLYDFLYIVHTIYKTDT
jgi:hypothetical protein